MVYLPAASIADTIGRIHKGDLVLPAIQREFVWEARQITALFDSLMRGYPIGGFLSWNVEPTTSSQFKFYGFLKDYNELSNRHCPSLDVPPTQAVEAVLDGQQRLTALNVGLRGSYAYRTWGGRRANPDSYPRRRLYLNILAEAPENEAGLRYDFRLLTDEQVSAFQTDSTYHWFLVSEIYACPQMNDVWKKAREIGVGDNDTAASMLNGLWQAVHGSAPLHFYKETDQDIDRVLDIFIRVNSAGTRLSQSDLLLSIATAQWDKLDARQEVHGLVDTLNSVGQGFSFTQDTVLKSGLVLAEVRDFAFRVRNFNASNMATLQNDWERIGRSLRLAVDILADFGLSDATLTADSVVIPVAYYVHRRQLKDDYLASPKHGTDRSLLRSWVLRSLVMPGIWGSGLDTLLRDITESISFNSASGFPLKDIEARMATRGKSLEFGEEQVEDLLNLKYGRNRSFATLALLFPFVDTRNKHHVDHVFPRSLLYTRPLKKFGFSDEEVRELQDLRDQLPNLQLLEGPINIDKTNRPPLEWANKTYPDDASLKAYQARFALPELPSDATEFRQFFVERRELLKPLLVAMLASPEVP